MLRFYMDHQVPEAITKELRRRGIDCIMAKEDGAREWDDERLLARALETRRIMVSQDVDFLSISARYQRSGLAFAGVVFAPQQGLSIGSIIRDIELIANLMSENEIYGRVVFLPI
jgi:hypothetical protein